jgi:RNA polymerase sigma-70 factor (ECF subfamily)
METTEYKFTGDDSMDLEMFKEIYQKYYAYLCLLAEYIVKDAYDAEEVVSDVFLKFWKHRLNIKKTNATKAYLSRAVRNTSLNYVTKIHRNDRFFIPMDHQLSEIYMNTIPDPLDVILLQEKSEIIQKGIETLPKTCKKIFLLSRNQEMSYLEISKHLSISVNTVKAQVKIALSKLRKYLNEVQELEMLPQPL